MTVTYPETRRTFSSDEFGPGTPEMATSWRALMDWENYTYNSDLPASPWDTKIFMGNVARALNAWTNDYHNAAQTAPVLPYLTRTSDRIGVYSIPSHRGASASVRWWFYLTLGATTSATLTLKNTRTLATSSVTVTYAALGFYAGWVSVDTPTDPLDVWELWATTSSGDAYAVESVCSYWVPTSLWAPAAWGAVSQAWAAADRPDSRYLARWLAQHANLFVASRGAPQCVASHLGLFARNDAGVNLGIYKVLIGARVSALKVAVLAGNSGAGTYSLLIKIDGVTAATISVTATTFAWYTATISITPFDATTAVEVTVERASTADAMWVASVTLWETGSSLSLPGAESVPASFTPNDNGNMSGGSYITAAQRSSLVANMVWMWSKRGLRCLICDCRWVSPHEEDTTPTRTPIDNDIEVQGTRLFAFADGAVGTPLFSTAYHNYAIDADVDLCYSWTDESGTKALAATATRVAVDTVAQPYQLLPFGMAKHVPWVTSASAEQVYTSWTVDDGGANPKVGTRISGLRIEQLPLNATAGTRY